MQTTFPHTVPPEHIQSAADLEQLAQEYDERGNWGIADIVRGAIEHLAEVSNPKEIKP